MRDATIDNNINFFTSDLAVTTLTSVPSLPTLRANNDPLKAAKTNSRDIDELFKRY